MSRWVSFIRRRTARPATAFVTAMAVALGLILVAPGIAVSAPRMGFGAIDLTVAAPSDGAALIEISRLDAAAPVRAVVIGPGEDPDEDVELVPGTYRITPRAMVVDGRRYVGRSDPMQVRVRAGHVSESGVDYVLSKGVQNLRATDLTRTSISLDWDAELGDGTTVWRVEGDHPATRPGQGRNVIVNGSSLTDTGLAPGRTYSYSIFARPGDASIGRADGDPVTITIGTAPEEGTTGEPLFVLNPRTVILASDDFAVAAPTGEGVRIDLQSGFPTPAPGTILAVPVTETLQGGYLGEVVSISDDGRTVWLAAAPMGAAFDLYHLAVPDITAVTATPQSQELSSRPQAPGEETRGRMSRSERDSPRPASRSRALGSPSRAFGAGTQALTAASDAVTAECSGGSAINVSSGVSTSHAGHANVTIDKYRILFVDAPSGVSLDVGYTATLKGTMDIQASKAVGCGINLKSFFWQSPPSHPVPLALEVRPKIAVSVSSAGSVSDLGFTATAGFEAEGRMDFGGGHSFDGDVIATGIPSQPTVSGAFGLGLEVSASVAFGPGVGSKNAGVLVGIGGDFYVVDASLGAKVVDDGNGPNTCVELSAATRSGVFVTARAWVPGYRADFTVPIEQLQGTFAWADSPWYWPDDCTESNTPTDDVVGDGVPAISDDLSGSSDQWGKVGGFVPGESTWVLSTGRIQDAVGQPSFFASTDLGGTGDAELSALSGFGTHDAAAFSVRVVPNGQTLKVRYAFASEEYPEFVGSSFNDVMAVFVDGLNCALIPGTQTPVSINTVNAGSHPQYYVDNSLGAAGYGTTMDGLTRPLTCSVPVTPGEPVTVKIAVADATDHIYDSAVALLDGGIWSE